MTENVIDAVTEPPRNARLASLKRFERPVPLYTAFVALILIACWPALASMADAWFNSSAYLHGAFAAPTAFLLIFGRRHEWGDDGDGGSKWPGLVGVSLASFALLLGRVATISVIEHFAVVGLLITGFAAFFGTRRFLRYAAPLGFLLFMPPFSDGLALPLQKMTAAVSSGVLTITGIDHARDGLLITTDVRRFMITESCSGVRMLTALLMVGFLISYIALNAWRRRMVVLVSAIGLALLANWARVYIVILLTVVTNDRYGLGEDHFLIGAVAFGLAVIALIGLTFHLMKTDHPAASQPPVSNPPRNLIRPILVLSLCGGMLFATNLWANAGMRAPARGIPTELPVWNTDDWQLRLEGNSTPFSIDHADTVSTKIYARGDNNTVTVSMAYISHDRPGAEIAGYASRTIFDKLRTNWRTPPDTITLNSIDPPIRVRRYGSSGHAMAVARFYWLDDKMYANEPALQFALIGHRLRLSNPPGGLFIVTARAIDKPQATAAVSAFLNDAEPFAKWHSRLSDGD